MTTREDIYKEVSEERDYQTKKWGVGPDDTINTPWMWTSYVVQYASNWMTGVFSLHTDNVNSFRRSMIKVAALAVAAVESLDRQRDKNGKAFYEK